MCHLLYGLINQSVRRTELSFNDIYRLGDSLGIGGQAEVFLAEHRTTGEQYALKRLSRVHVDDFESRQRMRREIEGQKLLNHPHVMPIYDHDPDYTWFTMPVADHSLEQYKDLKDISDDELFIIIEQSAKGLAAAHANNFVHRDIKPRNLLHLSVDGYKHWVISDWGYVRRHGNTTGEHTRFAIGTAGYSPPELEEDPHNATAACDVYSLGRVVARYVTGHKLRTNIALLPPENNRWYDFVFLTTQYEADDRPQNMTELLELLYDARSKLIRVPGKAKTIVEATGNTRKETFAAYHKSLLLFLWNDGSPQEVATKDIHGAVGASAYGNHKKLSLPPWNLLEDSDKPRHRRLTVRGLSFVEGELQIPLVITKTEIGDWIAELGTRLVTINDI